ncbi:MAG: glycine betaine ABC transporter substrate-binding protein [Clostridium sp.]|uniref:ABC transporter permease/substrate-binding protein n=1 Tax=Clostridium sp. TaxID=1506 RepID=UPI00302CF739
MDFLNYLIQNQNQIFTLLFEHIKLTTLSVGLSILIGVPLGILISYIKKLHRPVLGIANIVQAIPSMALLGFAIPFLGIGTKPAIVMVVLYSLLPIIKNTYTGIQNINPQMLEAARGIGLTKSQILTKIQIPLALPVIMAGVRISAVTAVGLMTMAAFIGGGGLGFLVFSGIRTVSNYQILAGAIPACLLALFVDFLVGTVENLVTPISLQSNNKDLNSKKAQRKTQKLTLGITAIGLVVIFAITGIGNTNTSKDTIVIGSKDFTEQEILCHLLSEAIESNTDISVERKPALGGTQICLSALKSDEIDMYVEYSGTAYGDILKHPAISDIEEVYNTVKSDFKEQFNIDVLSQFGFNNTYALAVTKDIASQYNLKTISDLSKVANEFTISPSLEFINRADGLVGLTDVYNFNFKNTIAIDGSHKYTALVNNESQVVDAFATDALIEKFDLVILDDDKHFFPPYYAIPVINSDTMEKYPEILPILDNLGLILNDKIMSELNYKVDELRESPQDVAKDFLTENGIIK